MANHPIDFVITWVDGGDPVWQAEKAKYSEKGSDSRDSRYRDWDSLRYLLRSMEKNAPFVNRIFFVTCGHLPAWLNTVNEKLVIVRHDEYIPEKFLPTFSSRTIDMNLHRIGALSEHFVYFNDDMLLLAPTREEDFFKNGLPCDTAILRPAAIVSSRYNPNERTDQMSLVSVVNMAMINKHFNKHRTIRKHLSKWFAPVYGKEMIKTLTLAPWDFFPGIRSYHCCYSYLKHTYEELWEKEESALEYVSSHRFRKNTDYNHWIFSYWQMAKGEFMPRSPKFGASFELNDDPAHNGFIYNVLKQRKYKCVCINDSVSDAQYDTVRAELEECMQQLFPEKSSFEK